MEIGPFWGEINLGNCDTRYTTTNNLLKLNQVNSLYISFPLKTYAVYSPVSVLSRTDYMGEIGSLPDGRYQKSNRSFTWFLDKFEL